MANLSVGPTINVPRELFEATVILLRKDALSLPRHGRERQRHFDILLQLYTISGFYPADHALSPDEVDRLHSEPFARGGWAEIWEGLFLGRQRVALKASRPSVSSRKRIKRTMREVNMWRSLKHPNIVPLIGTVIYGSNLYMISPWMVNGDLGLYLQQTSDVDCLSLLVQIATGLEYLHASTPPIVHGHICTGNVLISDTGIARITDFSLSSTATDENNPADSNDLRWMAPELVFQSRGVSYARRRTTNSDMFAFGRVALEIFTRRAPFEDLTTPQIIVKLYNGELPPRPQDRDAVSRGLNDHMWKLMEHCWEPYPENRPTAQHVVRWLRPAVEPPRREFQYFDYTLQSFDFLGNRNTELMGPLSARFQQRFFEEMARIRKEMIYLLPSDPKTHLDLLSEYYAITGFYPTDTLDECEIHLPEVPPSGSGGFGACWQGLFLGNHKVALKCSHPNVSNRTAAERAKREIKAWTGLQHPNVLPFIGSVTLKYITYLVSPWMEKGDASSYVKNYPDVDCVKLLAQIAEGLAYLHTHDPVVVHGDLKATNVFISNTGEARIGDFGLSQKLVEDISREFSTSWFSAGNFRWQAPELLEASSLEEARRTTSSDVFALGRVLLELFTRDVPFAGVPDLAVFKLVISGEHPARPEGDEIVAQGLDDQMWELMKDCCRLEASARPAAGEISGRLQALLNSRPSSKEPEQTPLGSSNLDAFASLAPMILLDAPEPILPHPAVNGEGEAGRRLPTAPGRDVWLKIQQKFLLPDSEDSEEEDDEEFEEMYYRA